MIRLKDILSEQGINYLVPANKSTAPSADSSKSPVTKYYQDKNKNLPGIKTQQELDTGHIKNIIRISDILYAARNAAWNPGVAKTLFNTPTDTLIFAIIIYNFTLKNNYNIKLLKLAISQVFRESKASIFGIINPKEILGFIDNIFGGNHSQGYSQIQPSTAKQYGININSLYTLEGSLKASYKMISTNYAIARKYYSGPTVSVYDANKTIIQKPALDKDAALHMVAAAHNAGLGIITNWCKTNIPSIANPCNEKSREYRTGKYATTKQSEKISNYFPKKDSVHEYMWQVIEAYNMLQPLNSILK